MTKLLKELGIIVKDIHSRMIEENKADRMGNLERTIGLLQGRIEELEKREGALREYLGTEFIQDIFYQKTNA